MTAMLSHPWFTDADVFPLHRRSMLIQLKSIEEMLAGADPPRWVVILDQLGLCFHSRTRVVVHEYATIDLEPTCDYPPEHCRPPASSVLTEEDHRHLMTLLQEVTPDTLQNVNTEVIDGDFCTLTIVHGNPKWLAYAEVNLAGLPHSEQAIAARLAKWLKVIAADIDNSE